MKRLTFIGQSTYFKGIALSEPTDQISPTFIDFRSGDDPQILRMHILEHNPDVIIVFKPESIPHGALAGIDAIKIGWFTEPIPRESSPKWSKYSSNHRDLKRRLESAKTTDLGQFDKFISYDPLITSTLGSFLDVWKSYPLPVDDHFFKTISTIEVSKPQIGFFGRPTRYRDQFLLPSLHMNDILYVAHGAFGATLDYLLSQITVGINLHNENYPNFENRAPLHLASGHLLLSEPLSPSHGLEPGIDFGCFRSPDQLKDLLAQVFEDFEKFSLMKHRGRMKAEYFRASRIYEEILSFI